MTFTRTPLPLAALVSRDQKLKEHGRVRRSLSLHPNANMTKPLPLAAALLSLTIAPLSADPVRDQLASARAAKDSDAERELTLRLLEQNPTNPALLRSLAKLQLAERDHARCAESLARLGAALGKPDADLFEMRGDLAHATAETGDDRERAADAWQTALVLDPQRQSSLLRLASHHRRAGNRPAEALYRERLSKLRDHPDDHAALARAAVATRDWDAAIRHSTLLRERHANIETAKTWAATFDRLMQDMVALSALDARVDAAPADPTILLERAWLFDTIRIDELALADARHALKLRPASFAVQYQLAVLMAHSGQARLATEQFNIEARRYAYKHRRPDDSFFARLIDLEPRIADNDPAALAERSGLLRSEGQAALAMADAQRAVAGAPQLVAAQLALARCESDADHTAAAKSAYSAVLQLDGNNIATLRELGLLHMKLGDYAAAAPLLARHLELDPDKDLADEHARCFAALQTPRP
jgi:lipoprotein NlpI